MNRQRNVTWLRAELHKLHARILVDSRTCRARCVEAPCEALAASYAARADMADDYQRALLRILDGQTFEEWFE